MGKYKYERPERISLDEFRDMVEKITKDETKAFLILLYLTGARVTELCKLKIPNVVVGDNVQLEIVTLKQRKKSFYHKVRLLQLKKETPFVDFFIEYFEAVRDISTGTINMDSWLFPDINRWRGDNPRVYVWREIKKYNKNISPHAFRHSRLQKLADLGFSDREIKNWSGHARSESLDEYIRDSTKITKKISEAIE